MGLHDLPQSTAVVVLGASRHWAEGLMLSRGAERCQLKMGMKQTVGQVMRVRSFSQASDEATALDFSNKLDRPGQIPGPGGHQSSAVSTKQSLRIQTSAVTEGTSIRTAASQFRTPHPWRVGSLRHPAG